MGALTFASLCEHVGRELGVSDWVTIDQALIDTFASCTGDRHGFMSTLKGQSGKVLSVVRSRMAI